MAEKKEGSDALSNSHPSVENVAAHAELFLNKFPTYYYRFKTDVLKGSAAFLIQLRDSTK